MDGLAQTLTAPRDREHAETPGLGDKIEVKKDNWIMAVRPYPLDGAPVIKDKAGVIPKLGDRSDAVAALQRALNAQGYKLTVDAWFGDFTKKAVSAFQKSHGLPGSGILGKNRKEKV